LQQPFIANSGGHNSPFRSVAALTTLGAHSAAAAAAICATRSLSFGLFSQVCSTSRGKEALAPVVVSHKSPRPHLLLHFSNFTLLELKSRVNLNFLISHLISHTNKLISAKWYTN
jgi:hypothetical protein